MRGSSLISLEHWAVHESPILPFLAPAVFAPWLYSAKHQISPSPRVEKPRPLTKPCNPTNRRSKTDSGVARASWRNHGCRFSESLHLPTNAQNVKYPSTTITCKHFHSSTSPRPERHRGTKAFHTAISNPLHDPGHEHSTHDQGVEPARSLREESVNSVDETGTPKTSGADISASRINHGEDHHEVLDEKQSLRQRLEVLRLSASTTYPQSQPSHILQTHNNEHYVSEDTAISLRQRHTEWSARLAKLKLPSDHDPVNFADRVIRPNTWLDLLPRAGFTFIQMQDAWQNLAPELRIQLWPHIMLYYLEHSTTDALTFLNVTITMEPTPPPALVADAFGYITGELPRTSESITDGDRADILSTMQDILKHYKPAPTFSQHTLCQLVQLLPLRAYSTLQMLQGHDVKMHYNTLVQFSHALASSGQIERSISTLQQAITLGASTKSVSVLKTSSRLLRRSKGENGNYQESTKVVATLFNLGIHLNFVMYNTLLLNASEAGDPGTAWSIYKMIRDNNVEPDEYTYTIMMKLCRKTNEKQLFRYLYSELNPEKREVGPYLVTEILVCRYHFSLRSNFDHVLRFYELHCDLQPLRDLGIIPLDYESRYQPQTLELQRSKPSPCAGTLGLVLLTFVRQQQRILPIEHIYRRFRQLLEKGDPSILPLVATTHTYNVFLKAFCISSGSLARWRTIVREMVMPLPFQSINRETGQPLTLAPPDAQTWNIIVNGLSRAGQHADAQKLVELMKSRNMKPDVVTYNSLLNGFAHQQHVHGVVNVLQNMDRQGIRPDGYTQEALLRVRNRKRLLMRVGRAGNNNPGPEGKDISRYSRGFTRALRSRRGAPKRSTPFLTKRWLKEAGLVTIPESLLRDVRIDRPKPARHHTQAGKRKPYWKAKKAFLQSSMEQEFVGYG